ncbi:hypothetical protein R1flu_017664 [Riccia fluitans]|uniref:Uncharacterized protein n=1 Tax=Riccia fluitans TaxID=41844 RepID=A0ABD1ZFZ5_9MARC
MDSIENPNAHKNRAAKNPDTATTTLATTDGRRTASAPLSDEGPGAGAGAATATPTLEIATAATITVARADFKVGAIVSSRKPRVTDQALERTMKSTAKDNSNRFPSQLPRLRRVALNCGLQNCIAENSRLYLEDVESEEADDGNEALKRGLK